MLDITEKAKGVKIDLKPGDMLVYSGCELEHWREKFKGKECIQVFLHYNNRKTPGAKDNMFDKRPHLGLPLGLRDDIISACGGVLPPQSPTPHAYWRDMLGITAIAQSPIASLGGTNASVAVSGIELTTAVGAVTITAIQNPTIQLTGVTATTTLGAIQVDPDVIATGQDLTVRIGPYSIQADATGVILQGENELETAVGTLSVAADAVMYH